MKKPTQNNAVPSFANDRIWKECYLPPTVRWAEFVAATQTFRSQELPPFISVADLHVPAELQTAMMHAFRFMTLLTPTFQPTGSLLMLTQQPPPPTPRWSRDVWYIAKLAYRELFWRLNPETATRDEISDTFATYLKEPAAVSQAVDFFLELRSTGMDDSSGQLTSPKSSKVESPREDPSSQHSPLSQLTFSVPLTKRRSATVQLPSDFGGKDLDSIESMLTILRASLTDE